MSVIRGKVVGNDGPVEYATIYLEGTNIHTVSDAKGMFALSVPPGTHRLAIQYLGYKTHRETVQVRRGDKLIRHVRLSADGTEVLREHVVEAKGRNRHLRERGFALEAIDTHAAALQNVQTADLLNRSAGVKIRQSAGLGSDMSFNLNGLSGNSVRIFIDGIPLRNYGRSFSIANIPPSMIERIEVYKGVLPSELAEDALGGGINIVLKRDMRSTLMTSYAMGSFGTHQWDLNGSYRHKPIGLTVRGSAYYNTTDNSYEVWGPKVYTVDALGNLSYVRAKRFHDGFTAYGVRADVGITRQPWADELTLGLMLNQTTKEIQTGATMEVVYGDRHTKYGSKVANLQYSKNNLLLKGLDLSAMLSYSITDRQVIDTVGYIYGWDGKVRLDPFGRPARSSRHAEAGNPTLAINDERTLTNRTNIHYHLSPGHKVAVNYFYDHFTRDTDDAMLTA